MKKKLIWIFGAVLATLPMAWGQDSAAVATAPPVGTTVDVKPAVWTLQQCINWAKQQNITIQRNRVAVRSADIDLDNAKKAWLPSVNFSTSHQYSNMPFRESSVRVVNDEVVTTSNKNSYSGNYNVGASMTLWDGGMIKNNRKLAEINSQMAQLDVDASELNIEEQVTQLFVQILYTQEAIKQDSVLIELSQKQLERGESLFKAGLLNKADVAQLQSQVASDRYQKVTDETSRDSYKLQLKQLLELDGDEALVISDPDLESQVLTPLPAKADVYAHAVQTRPEIKAQQLAMDRTHIDEEIAKAGNSPTLTANANIGTSNMTNNGNMFTQLKNQWTNGVGVTLSIPIWDHGKTSNAVSKARLERETAYLDMLDTQKNLWKSIETYWLNAYSAQQRYLSAQEQVNYRTSAYELTSEQFRLGLKNIIELTTDKTNLSSATQQLLQAKYMALYNIAMLRYYNGQAISLD